MPAKEEREEMVVAFEPLGLRVTARRGDTILRAYRQLGPEVADGLGAYCGGLGFCGRCRVRVEGMAVSAPSDAEARNLSAAELALGYRLACQACLEGSVRVTLEPAAPAADPALQVDGDEPDCRVEGVVTRRAVSRERVTRRLLGLAVDLGTTKIAGCLVDLETGVTVARTGMVNPQVAYGDDVVSRLGYALDGPESYGRVRSSAVEGLNALASVLAAEIGLSARDIETAVVVGNTAMHHLLLGLPIARLVQAPYHPAVSAPIDVKAQELGLRLAPEASVFMPPVIAGFVGSDHVAMIQAAGLDRADRVVLGYDIGTNTEIVLAARGELVSCSCASGPAFEGARILWGMRAAAGAVDGFEFQAGGSAVSWHTISEARPLGLCGSGVLSAVAGLCRAGVINRNGCLACHPLVSRPAGGPARFLLAPASQSGTGADIVLTQRDIGEIQLAKAAIATGADLLLSTHGLGASDVAHIVVAGAFGTRLRVDDAVTIGLFPDISSARFRQVGNAAIVGAKLMLVSREERRRALEIARKARHLSLAAHPAFRETFADNLTFPPGPAA